jgi:hypothetical protein
VCWRGLSFLLAHNTKEKPMSVKHLSNNLPQSVLGKVNRVMTMQLDVDPKGFTYKVQYPEGCEVYDDIKDEMEYHLEQTVRAILRRYHAKKG